MKYEFDVNLYGFSDAGYEQFMEALERCNAPHLLSHLGGEENLEHVCEHLIAETAQEAVIVAIDQKCRLAMFMDGGEVIINLHNDRPGETAAQ